MIEYLAANPTLFVGIVFFLSLLVGSFLNVVIYRLPIMLERDWKSQCSELLERDPETSEPERFNLFFPASHCPSCNNPVRAWQNIPLISYIVLGGKCSVCGTAIGLRYPLVELSTAVLSAAVAFQFGFGITTYAALVLTWALIVLTVIDLDRQLLPDNITLPLMWLGLLLSLVDMRSGLPLFADTSSSLIGAVTGYLGLWFVFQLFKLLTGKEGMGYGDFKLAAALGAWLGWQMLPLIVVLSAFVGAVVGILMIVSGRQGRDKPLPFGPFLAGAAWIALLWGDAIVAHYFRLTGMA